MHDDTVIRATRDWIEKAVIGLDLCPFARAVYRDDRVRFVVSHAPHADAYLEQLDAELDLLAATPASEIDTTLLLHPHLFPEFDAFQAITEIAEEAVREHDLEGVIQVASFHPAFRFADTEADDITNYTNRSPFPMLHLLREDSISAGLAHFPDPDQIYLRNMRTLRALGPAGWQELWTPADSDEEDSP